MTQNAKQIAAVYWQAITTSGNGLRIRATCEAGSQYTPYDDALSYSQNHASAALALATRLGWLTPGKTLHMGSLRSGFAFLVIEE